ncbi:hypothetical protein F4810DRAFT_712207 [Camillea tinctor]|nr:hypothetical protein F4810DRAFT_712207 [Camillea tinctor]
MAIVEFVYPKLKPEVAKKAEEEVIPVAINEFKNVGVLNGLRGWVETEDGRDVSADMREVLVLQWPSTSTFHEFVKSDGYFKFQSLLKPLATGPPTLKLYDANDVSQFFSSEPVLEVLEIQPKGDDAEGALQKIQAIAEKITDPKVVAGTTSNLDKKEFVIARLFEDKSELQTKAAGATRRELLASISEVAEVTQLVAKVVRIPF